MLVCLGNQLLVRPGHKYLDGRDVALLYEIAAQAIPLVFCEVQLPLTQAV